MTDNNVSQAEREADAARAQLEQSLDQLRASLRPGHLFDQTMDYARNSGGADFARNLGRQMRDNPLPIALIGAGIAWLMLAPRNAAGVNGDIESRFRSAANHFGEDDSDAPGQSFASQASDLAEQAGDALASARDRAAATARSATEGASEATRRMSTSAAQAGDSLRRGMHDARGQAASAGRKLKDGVTTIMDEQPLVLGAVGLALGAVIAAALPTTRVENKIAGTFSDDMKDELKDAASDVAGRAANVVDRVFDSAYREGEAAARDEGLLSSPRDTDSRDKERQDSEQAMATGSGA
ncbi:DUF3618 domain-containing protein [Pseudorhodoplanes sp.]|uniref:DUF3618 domain-containing protein n=1 Tax=Pseudorhodoplanes sp. TaxID=1934341 RepID=UPI002D10DCC8|nr:DUF3618 domain-containing protein [Pseudorhodoplanes sp.]HWV53058.1 DUF3618 domain-containing protein [Pseudorhodoplanes sp.]